MAACSFCACEAVAVRFLAAELFAGFFADEEVFFFVPEEAALESVVFLEVVFLVAICNKIPFLNPTETMESIEFGAVQNKPMHRTRNIVRNHGFNPNQRLGTHLARRLNPCFLYRIMNEVFVLFDTLDLNNPSNLLK
jgi:hypothetical protein